MKKLTITKTLQAAVLGCAIIYFCNLSVSAQNDQSEKIISVKTVSGKFVRFVVGDFIHAQIKMSNGKTKYYFLDSYEVQYFLVLNRGKIMSFIYEVVATYLGESGKRAIIERIKSARIGKLTFEKWWRYIEKRYSAEQIKKKYDLLVEKYKNIETQK